MAARSGNLREQRHSWLCGVALWLHVPPFVPAALLLLYLVFGEKRVPNKLFPLAFCTAGKIDMTLIHTS